MTLALFAQYVMNGAMLGMMYALVAVGFTLFFGVLDIIQFSHGAVVAAVALSGLAAWTVRTAAGVTAPGLLLLAVIATAAIVTALLGAVVARFIVLPVKTAPQLNVLLVTLMGGTVLRECIRLFYPGGSQPKLFPALLPTSGWNIGAFHLRFDNVILLVAALQTVGAVALPFASAYKDVFAFGVVILLMAIRPTGLIGESASERV